MNSYHPLLKTAYFAREQGIKELADLRARQKSESMPEAKLPSPQTPPAPEKAALRQLGTPEMPKRLPLTKTEFKTNISKIKIKSEPMVIDGIEHLGIIHDISLTREPRVYRFCGDRYMARIHLSPGSYSLLDMKEVTQRRILFTQRS